MSTGLAPTKNAVACPYVGLRHFRETDAQLFYGCDEQIVDLLSKLSGHRFVAVLGASASGKSSLVRAGIIPELRSGMIPHAGHAWKIVEFKPGTDPLGELSSALSKSLSLVNARSTIEEGPLGIVRAVATSGLDPGVNVLIIADQFEEIFRFQREKAALGRGRAAEEQCQALVRRLLDCTDQSEIPIYVLLVMRSDYLGECNEFPDLPERMSASLYIAPRLRRDQLGEAITAPLGGRIEPALAQRLINEAGSSPDQLPRLQHLLSKMWEIAGGAQITLEHYAEVGGWTKGLEKDLDRIYDDLNESQQGTCRRIFQSLSELDKGRTIRRRVALNELRNITGSETDEVVAKFHAAGFLSLYSDTVDVTHECVLRCWSKVGRWVEGEIKERDFYLQLIDRQKRGAALGRADLRDATNLRRSGGLTRQWALRYSSIDDFTAAMELIDNARIRLRWQNVMILAIICIALSLGYSVVESSNLQERDAETDELATSATSWEERDPARALYLAVSAYRNASRSRRLELQHIIEEAIGNHPSFVVLRGHERPVTDVSWNPGGDVLASASEDERIKLWDAANGRLLRTLVGSSAQVTSVSWSPNGKTLASGGKDNTVRLWDVTSGRVLQELTGHSDYITRVSWSPDGKILASAGRDNAVRLWDAASGRGMRTLSKHTDYVTSVSWSPDGRMLASGSWDQTILIWDSSNGRVLRTLNGHAGQVTSISWSPDGKTLASGNTDQKVRLWDVASGQQLSVLDGHTAEVTSVSWSPDGKTVASGSADETMRVWDTGSGKALEILHGHSNSISQVSWSPDGRTLASGSSDETVRLWNPMSGQTLRTLRGHTDQVTSASWSQDGKTLASGGWDQTVRLWDPATGRALRVLSGHTDRVTSVSWNPLGKTLASGSWDQTVRLWDPSSGRALRALSGHTGQVTSISWSPDGKTLASGSWDKTVRLWDPEGGQVLSVLTGHTRLVNSVSWSPDGKTLASASADHTVRLWDAKNGRLLRTIDGHSGAVESVVWCSGGKTLASASADGTILEWDSSTGRALNTFGTHTYSPVNSVASSLDGKTLASGNADGVVQLWDEASEKKVRTLNGHTDPVLSVSWSPDGKTLASASADGTLRFWPGNEDALLTQARQAIRLFSLAPDDCQQSLRRSSCPPM